MKAIQCGIVALIAVCWALTGCGGEAEDSALDEYGQLEQASIGPKKADNRRFYWGVDFLDPKFGPGQGSPGQFFDFGCGRAFWTDLITGQQPRVQGWRLTTQMPFSGDQAAKIDVGGQFEGWAFLLDALLEPSPAGDKGVCPLSCRDNSNGFAIQCPFNKPRPSGALSFTDPWIPDFNVKFNTGPGNATTALASANPIDGAGGTNVRLGYQVTFNTRAIRARAASLGIGTEAIVSYLLCRHIGLAFGLNPRSSSGNTCLGNEPTTAAQWASRAVWDSTDKGDIRNVYLSRPLSATEQ